MSEQIWKIENKKLVWEVREQQIHRDKIEMSGLYCDSIIEYGVHENGELLLSQKHYFPMLRTIPNNTHGTFCFALNEARPFLLKNGEKVSEYPRAFHLDGMLTAENTTNEGISVTHRLFPSIDSRFAVERVYVRANQPIELTLSVPNEFVHSYGRGTKGVYVSTIFHTAPAVISLNQGESTEFDIFYTSRIANETLSLPNGTEEEYKRAARVSALCDGDLILETGCEELDLMTRFAKLRAGESIFETITGKYHSPGGSRYYAATWCNDQIEYAGPHFAMTRNEWAIEASLNAYRSYIPFMSDNYTKLPSSIIAEGLDIWEGAGDRGDAAMYLYGASFFCLCLGNRAVAEELYPAIQWCAEYCERRKSPEGVICSDSDELEGRFPTDGYANLSTSSLCYGGLKLAAKLAHSLGDEKHEQIYTARAEALESAMEAYFGAELHGFQTYRYSKGFDTLRAWICLPLCMGIGTRAEGTLSAMLSPYLWTEEGMLSCERGEENKNDTIWDRSTLYGMKCAFLNGIGNQMMERLLTYCRKRLVCDCVPYAVEAYPEGGKRQLSGESALFVRMITEGLFGILPEGLDAFSFTPQLPERLKHMHLKSVPIASSCFDIFVEKNAWKIAENGVIIAQGETNGSRILIKTKK